MVQVEGPGYAYEIDYGDGPQTILLSEAREALRKAEQDARWAHHEADMADDVVATLRFELRYAVCDHPDSTGYVCDDCHQYTDPDPESLVWDAFYRDSYADGDAMPDTDDGRAYEAWMRRRRWGFPI